jgi:hypothetical protein
LDSILFKKYDKTIVTGSGKPNELYRRHRP